MDGEEILEKIENINMRINALKNVIIKYTNGELSESDSLEQLLDDELFQESYSDRKDDCITEIGIIIEHILKIKYCTNDRNHKTWINSIKTHRGTFEKYVRWGSKKSVDRLIKHTSENINDCYEYGVVLYTRDSDEYPDLKVGLSQIPEECPWTLEEIIDETIDYLLNKLDEEEK